MAFDEALGASYRLGERIGSGAAGEVWLATDIRTGETVAAKILRPEHAEDPSLVERFVRERSILIGLRHPNIVAVRDLVVEGDRLAIVMDYLDGGSLRDALAGMGNAPPEAAARITAAVLDGLAAAHQKQVLHRDIKPDNVLLRSDWREETDGIKVTDFGIAGLITERPRNSTGLIGTPEYMSPELITTGAAGPATDVYGAGILLYELMAGRTPYAGPGTDFTVAYRHVTVELPHLDLPGELWSLLQRLLAKSPKARPTAADAAAALRRLDPALRDVPPLAPVSAPEEFTEAPRPATALRSIFTDPDEKVEEGTVSTPQSPQSPSSLPDLGTPTHATMHRPMLRHTLPTPDDDEDVGEEQAPERPWWKAPWAIAAGVGALALLVVVAVVLIKVVPKSKPTQPSPSPQAAFQASQQDEPMPTGLGISRKAEYDASSGQIQLTIEYSAQKSPLRGPFLEVLPGVGKGAGCPTVTWADGAQQQNLPSVTGINRPCGWSISNIEVAAQSTEEVSVTVHQKITDEGQLQSWLDAAAKATTDAVEDPDVTGTAYPVQRLQDIEVSTPSRIVSEKTLPITLVPVWPSGNDKVNPLYQSPSSGDPSTMLVAIAGGTDGVRFSDGCSGALTVSSDGLTVTTLSQAPECTVNARVGNFTDLASSPFAIVTRGG